MKVYIVFLITYILENSYFTAWMDRVPTFEAKQVWERSDAIVFFRSYILYLFPTLPSYFAGIYPVFKVCKYPS
jgi:hypothetical protein